MVSRLSMSVLKTSRASMGSEDSFVKWLEFRDECGFPNRYPLRVHHDLLAESTRTSSCAAMPHLASSLLAWPITFSSATPSGRKHFGARKGAPETEQTGQRCTAAIKAEALT